MSFDAKRRDNIISHGNNVGCWDDVADALRRLQAAHHPSTEDYDHFEYAIALVEWWHSQRKVFG